MASVFRFLFLVTGVALLPAYASAEVTASVVTDQRGDDDRVFVEGWISSETVRAAEASLTELTQTDCSDNVRPALALDSGPLHTFVGPTLSWYRYELVGEGSR